MLFDITSSQSDHVNKIVVNSSHVQKPQEIDYIAVKIITKAFFIIPY